MRRRACPRRAERRPALATAARDAHLGRLGVALDGRERLVDAGSRQLPSDRDLGLCVSAEALDEHLVPTVKELPGLGELGGTWTR